MVFKIKNSSIKIKREKLPLLEMVQSAYSGVSLSDTYVICAQHLLKTSVSLFSSLFEMGLLREHFSVIGKCYSTDPSVYFDLKSTWGLDVCSSSEQFVPEQSFDHQYTYNIREFVNCRIEQIVISNCKKLIVVDDGGELIEAVNNLVKQEILPSSIQIIGVEQTSSGLKKLQKNDLLFPVINVARSDVKLHLESSLIAESLMENLLIALQNLHIKPAQALILGKGAIGRKVEENLLKHCAVDSFDPTHKNCSILDPTNIDFSRYDLIIGCSGTQVMDPSHYKSLKKGTVLASASSSDREFCGMLFRQDIRSLLTCHDHLIMNGIHLLNCGFPVNFSNYYTLVDNDRYQLTRSLLLTGILQGLSMTGSHKGFVNLSSNMQYRIYNYFLSLYPTVHVKSARYDNFVAI